MKNRLLVFMSRYLKKSYNSASKGVQIPHIHAILNGSTALKHCSAFSNMDYDLPIMVAYKDEAIN